jgi:hypothetical protein
LIDIYVINAPSYSSKDFIFINQGNGSYVNMSGIDSFICESYLGCASVGIMSYHVQDVSNDNIADILSPSPFPPPSPFPFVPFFA